MHVFYVWISNSCSAFFSDTADLRNYCIFANYCLLDLLMELFLFWSFFACICGSCSRCIVIFCVICSIGKIVFVKCDAYSKSWMGHFWFWEFNNFTFFDVVSAFLYYCAYICRHVFFFFLLQAFFSMFCRFTWRFGIHFQSVQTLISHIMSNTWNFLALQTILFHFANQALELPID